MKPTNRRSFLQVTGAAMAFPYVGKVLGANEKLNIGVVGVAGRGGSNLRGVAVKTRQSDIKLAKLSRY